MQAEIEAITRPKPQLIIVLPLVGMRSTARRMHALRQGKG
jgi:hypothetical protein